MNAFSSKKSFTLESFYQLLHGRIFYGNVDYAQWLMHCIDNASLPIPTIFAHAIKEFVSRYKYKLSHRDLGGPYSQSFSFFKSQVI